MALWMPLFWENAVSRYDVLEVCDVCLAPIQQPSVLDVSGSRIASAGSPSCSRALLHRFPSQPSSVCGASAKRNTDVSVCATSVSAPQHVSSLKHRSTTSGGPGPEHVFLDNNPSAVNPIFVWFFPSVSPPTKGRWDGREYETGNEQEFRICRAQRWSERVRVTPPDLSVRRPRGFIQTRGAFPARRRRPEAADVNKRGETASRLHRAPVCYCIWIFFKKEGG